MMEYSGVGSQWLLHAEEAAHVGHELLQALQEGHLLLAVHCGRRAAGRQLVEGVGQTLVDHGVPLGGQQGLHQLRVLRLKRGAAEWRNQEGEVKVSAGFIYSHLRLLKIYINITFCICKIAPSAFWGGLPCTG